MGENMSSCNFYQAEKKDVKDIIKLLRIFKQDLSECNYPEIKSEKLQNFIYAMLEKGKIICVKNLDDNNLIGVCIFYKTSYWWSDDETMVIQLIYVLKQYRNYKLVKQLIDSIKQVSKNLPISLSIIAKLNGDKLFEKLGFENMGSNWRLK
jgi:N-acetylglutamate synthase-like GNAT family acetyltransferase